MSIFGCVRIFLQKRDGLECPPLFPHLDSRWCSILRLESRLWFFNRLFVISLPNIRRPTTLEAEYHPDHPMASSMIASPFLTPNMTKLPPAGDLKYCQGWMKPAISIATSTAPPVKSRTSERNSGSDLYGASAGGMFAQHFITANYLAKLTWWDPLHTNDLCGSQAPGDQNRKRADRSTTQNGHGFATGPVPDKYHAFPRVLVLRRLQDGYCPDYWPPALAGSLTCSKRPSWEFGQSVQHKHVNRLGGIDSRSHIRCDFRWNNIATLYPYCR